MRHLIVVCLAFMMGLNVACSRVDLFVEVFDDLLENAVFDGALGTIDHHQAGFVPVFGRVFRQQVGGEVVTVLR